MGDEATAVPDDLCCFRGPFIHSTKLDPLVISEDKLLGISKGKIIFIEDGANEDSVRRRYNIDDDAIRVLSQGQVIIPGFIDTHIHASQYTYAGTNLDLGLLDWLEKYTFPTEALYKDLHFAKKHYQKVVERVLSHGTTTASYFATIHVDATLALCDIIDKCGQRAYVGKVNMDQNSPKYYSEETRQSADDTEEFIKRVLEKSYKTITPIITPRFAPSCSRGLMEKLGDLAEKYDLPIQSHLSESRKECAWIKQLYPDSRDYTSVYHECKLLTKKTIMAHSIYLSDEELGLIKAQGVGVSHCPNSNLSIRSGLLDVRRLLDRGIKVGLGTDLAGGYHPSIMNAIQTAVHVANTLSISHHGDEYNNIDFREAFRLATLGGAEVMGLENKIGNFEIGKEFDALVIGWEMKRGPFEVFDHESLLDAFQKFLFLGDDRNIREVFVAGKQLVVKPEDTIT
ncbi:guanine deaminase-like [Lineus longissimus]|uniref:guanine deaminase-like n=1 Tax=Lineus longissimus TaxID=88925 RepID=UPI002B4E0BFD